MSKIFLFLSLWELSFLFYILYYFSFQISLFPWSYSMPDRWGESIILMFFWILFFFFCVPILFEIKTKHKKKLFKTFSIFTFLSLFSFLFHDTLLSYFGYLTISIISLYKTVDLIKNIKISSKKV